MNDLLSPSGLLSLWDSFYRWLREDALVPDHTLQAAILIVSLGAALLVARAFRRWLERRYAPPPGARGLQMVALLAAPVAWLLLLLLAVSASNALRRPHGMLGTVATLVAAWIGIHLASQVVKNPLWSKLITWTAWSIAALSIVGLLDPTIAALDSVAIQTGQLRISIYTVLRSTVALAVLLSVALYLTGLIESRIRTSRDLSPTVQVLFTKSLRTVLVAFAVLIAVHSVGIDLTALAVVGGAIGLGAGFGLQRIVSNLISGVILLIDRSVKPGDVIAVSGTYGWVTALGGRYVSVVTRDGVEHLIPNETLIAERVENWTHTHSRTRLKIDVPVHYRSDVKQVIAICEQAASDTARVLREPPPKCLLIQFGDSALELQLRFWIADAQNGVQNVKSEVLLRIWETFRQQGIEVPYSQLDLHIHSNATAIEPVSDAR